jgi:hypothetical protein
MMDCVGQKLELAVEYDERLQALHRRYQQFPEAVHEGMELLEGILEGEMSLHILPSDDPQYRFLPCS